MSSEPMFVPNPEGDAEDDGVVLSYVWTAEGYQVLVVLDGKSLT